MNLLRLAAAILSFAFVMLLTGCAAGMDSEEREFFYGSWVHPDAAAQERYHSTETPQKPVGFR